MAAASPQGRSKLWQRHSQNAPEDFGAVSGPLSPTLPFPEIGFAHARIGFENF